MSDQIAQHRDTARKIGEGMRTVLYLCLATNAFDLYRFAGAPADLRHGLGAAMGILGTIMVWQAGKNLRAAKKQALPYWLAMAILGYARFIFVEGTFELNPLTLVLMLSALGLTSRMFVWSRNGALD